MKPKFHQLKILPEYFNAIKEERKTFEIRKNDRDYQVGDILALFNYEKDKHLGEVITREITYISDYAQKRTVLCLH